MKKKFSLEQIFLSALHSNQKLKWYLQYDINIVNYLDAKWKKFMALADMTLAMIPKNKIREVVGDVDAKRILKILEKERLDLYNTLMKDPNGLNWLGQQIKNFEERFL